MVRKRSASRRNGTPSVITAGEVSQPSQPARRGPAPVAAARGAQLDHRGVDLAVAPGPHLDPGRALIGVAAQPDHLRVVGIELAGRGEHRLQAAIEQLLEHLAALAVPALDQHRVGARQVARGEHDAVGEDRVVEAVARSSGNSR